MNSPPKASERWRGGFWPHAAAPTTFIESPMPPDDIYQLPPWATFVFTAILVLLALRVGFRAGLSRSRKQKGDGDGPIGSVVGATLGLLAFILAFTFGIAASRFDSRKQVLLDEVNAIGTAVLRAEMLPEPPRSESRKLFKRYVDIRATLKTAPEELLRAIAEAEGIQDQLWSLAVAAAKTDMNSDIGAQYVESLNEVFELHRTRVTIALLYRIPTLIWAGLFLVTAISMGMVGYQFGLSGRMSIFINLALAVSFSCVVLLIASLDQPRGGMLWVSQKPMVDLKQRLDARP